MKKYLQLVIFGGLIICLSKTIAMAQEPIPTLIINQLRGNESCCEKGTVDMFTTINSDPELGRLPIGWVLRYDLLTDEDSLTKLESIPPNQSLGILLEITPKLASASAVIYKGQNDGSDWSNARNVFLIGYTQTERKKIIDTVFNTYFTHFHTYPTFTAAWMIDSWSLQYIRQTFGVQVHELTKEQFETDAYTLYGGIFNLPFFPSLEHPLVPGNSETGLDLLIVRQTISDIDKNYGSYKSWYTSQPNDYLNIPGQDVSYFKNLLEVTAAQYTGNKFALIGLENSKEWQKYKDEYLRQLKYLADQEKLEKVKLYSPLKYFEEFTESNRTNPVRFLKSPTFPQQGELWYFGKNYRALLEIQNEQLLLTDLRIFSPLVDPYQNIPADKSYAYWIIPYLLDSSQQFSVIDDKNLEHKGEPVRTDPGVSRFGIELVSGKIINFKQNADEIILSTSVSEVHLQPEKILLINNLNPKLSTPINLTFAQLLKLNTPQYFTFARHPRFVMLPIAETQEIKLGWENPKIENIILAKAEKLGNGWEISPNLEVTTEEIVTLSHIFQPDRSSYAFEPAASIFYWNNKEAVAGRNPVRLYIDPRNIFSRPAAIKNMIVNLTQPQKIQTLLPNNHTLKLEPFFIDFTASESAKSDVSLQVSGQILPGAAQIRFYENCQEKFWQCLVNPTELKGNMKLLFEEKIHELTKNFQANIETVKQKLLNWQTLKLSM